MGLQVWLPFANDIKNYGLEPHVFSYNNATFIENDKKSLFINNQRSNFIVSSALSSTNEISVSLWVKMLSGYTFAIYSDIVTLGVKNQTYSTYLRLETCNEQGTTLCWFANDVLTNSSGVGAVGVSLNTWYHIVLIFNGTKFLCYCNSNLIESKNVDNIYLNHSFTGEFSFGDSGMYCYLSDVRIYDHCLTEQDIQNIYLTKTLDLVVQGLTTFDRSGLLSSDIVKYNITTLNNAFYFNGTDAAIQIPFENLQQGEFSMNTWFYKDSFGSKGWETIFGGPSGFELQTKRNSTASPVIVMYSWNNNAANDIPYELNKWNMLTMTRNANGSKFYLNGELKQTGSTGYIPSGNYFIGAWRDSNSQNYKGYVKEFSIYAKALEASDITKLYAIGPQVDILPDGYTRLEYIEGTGTQWINTNWHPTTNFKVNTKIYVSNINSTDEYGLFGNWTDGGGVAFGYWNKQIYWGAGTTSGWKNLTYIPITSNTVTIQYNASQTLSSLITSEGSTSSTTILYTFNDTTNPCFIFKPRYSNNGAPFVGKLYYLNIIQNEVMERYFIPSKRNSDNVVGLYDMVTKTFFTNAGTGTFTAGPAI